MIEENVVSRRRCTDGFTAQGIQDSITEAGFEPQLRNQKITSGGKPGAITLEEQL